jgi:hypothetical protein
MLLKMPVVLQAKGLFALSTRQYVASVKFSWPVIVAVNSPQVRLLSDTTELTVGTGGVTVKHLKKVVSGQVFFTLIQYEPYKRSLKVPVLLQPINESESVFKQNCGVAPGLTEVFTVKLEQVLFEITVEMLSIMVVPAAVKQRVMVLSEQES